MNNHEKIKKLLWNLIWFSLGMNFVVFVTVLAWARKKYFLLIYAAIIIGLTIVSRNLKASIRRSSITYFDMLFLGTVLLFVTVFCSSLIYFAVSWGGVIAMGVAVALEIVVGIILLLRMKQK